MNNQKQSLFSVEQAIDAAKWDKHSTWNEVIDKADDGKTDRADTGQEED